jgi:hypothetical protein
MVCSSFPLVLQLSSALQQAVNITRRAARTFASSSSSRSGTAATLQAMASYHAESAATHALVVIDFMLTYLFIAEIFRQHFDRFGKVVEAQIMVDHTSGRSRGFG